MGPTSPGSVMGLQAEGNRSSHIHQSFLPRDPEVSLQGDVKTKDHDVISQKSQPKSHEIDSSQKEEG